MTRSLQAALCVCAIVTFAAPDSASAQQSSIAVTATVLPRPLSLLGAARRVDTGELVVRVDGCGNGAITVDARTATATRRTLRMPVDAANGCAPRAVSLRVSAADSVLSYLVTLEQSDTLISPAFAQIVVPAAGWRGSVAY